MGQAAPELSPTPTPLAPKGQPRGPLPPRPIRWLLRGWWGLAALVFSTILGILLGVPLANKPDHWWEGVQVQFGASLALINAYRWQSALAALVVVAVTVAAYLENGRVLDEERKQRLADIGEAVAEVLDPPLELLSQGQQELSQLQDAALTLGEENLTVSTATLAIGMQTLSAIEQLGRSPDPSVEIGTQRGPTLSRRIVALAEMPRHGTLIGREEQMTQLVQRLTSGDDVGIFALKGMGGVGKTALAAEAVSLLAPNANAFPGGVVWIACAGLTGASGLTTIVEKVARVLGMEAVLAQVDTEQRRQNLTSALANREPTLLALDNIEPGLDAELLLQALAVPEHTTILLTSREQVALHLLRVLEVAPLPDREATDLFAVRIAQATGDARPTEIERTEIPQLVDAVGGLALAVELLARYAGTQGSSLRELAADLAAEGINAAAFHTDPHRTLTRTFDRSWMVLTASQQRLFAGLCLLPETGFPRAAALALGLAAQQSEVTTTEHVMVDVAPAQRGAERDLVALVDAALIERLEGGRLRLHQMLRDYARLQLTALGQQDASIEARLGTAMVAYWVAYAQAHAGYQWGIANPNYADVDFLEAEANGLLEAGKWAHEHELYREVLALGHAISDAWDLRGRRGDSRQLLPWQLEAARALGDRSEERWAIHELAVLDDKDGKREAARAGVEEALRLAQELGDKVTIQIVTHDLAVLDYEEGNHAAARAGYQEALRLAQELGDKAAIQRATELLEYVEDQERRGG